MTVAWDFGDGNTATEALDSPVRHTYTTPGQHTVTAEVEGEQVAKPVTARFRNLLANDNHASVEEGTLDGWSVPSGLTAASSTDRALHGSRSVRIESTQSNAGWNLPFGDDFIELGDVGGRTITFMCGLFLDGPTRWPSDATIRLRFDYRREAGTGIRTDTHYFDASVIGEWTPQRFEWICPAGTVRARMDQFYISGGGLSMKRCYLDRLGLFVGNVPWEAWSLPSEFQP
jgi:hypothetical protein